MQEKYGEYYGDSDKQCLEFCEDFADRVTLYLESNNDFIKRCSNRVKFYEVLGL